jgi:hypothetical protein
MYKLANQELINQIITSTEKSPFLGAKLTACQEIFLDFPGFLPN